MVMTTTKNENDIISVITLYNHTIKITSTHILYRLKKDRGIEVPL